VKTLHANLARGWRGGERQTLLLVEGLRQTGDEAEILARRGEPLAIRAAQAGIPVHHAPTTVFRARSQDFDVIHTHEPKALQWSALARTFGGPPVVTTRRVDNRPGNSWLTRFKYSRADAIVAISEYVRQIMIEWGEDPGRISVIPSAVPGTCSPADPDRVSAIRAQLGGGRIIGFVGALVNKHKDPLTLLRAFHRLRQRDERLALLIVGDGPDRHSLDEYINSNNIGGIHMTGFVDDPETYYACMDVFALPSRMEGLGTAALDAFAWELPVIAGKAGALPEIVRDHETGILFEPGDDAALAEGIDWLLRHPQEAQSLARAGKQLLHERHDPAVMTEAYRALYQSLHV
jgi:glycosyltransferase involved in cell wall biosynthesis